MAKKLTMVSITARGRRVTKFIRCEMVNGKAILPREEAERILEKDLGIKGPGVTYSVS